MKKKTQTGTLTNRIPELRARKKFTQQQLAEKTGVTRQTIISIEKGRYTPSLILAFEVALALDSTINEVFNYEKEHDS